MCDIKYPDIKVPLVGESDNAFAILGACNKAMRRGGLDRAERDKFKAEAMSGDYDNLLCTAMKWFNVE